MAATGFSAAGGCTAGAACGLTGAAGAGATAFTAGGAGLCTGAGCCCCSRCSFSSLRTSPGLEILERSIFGLISGAALFSLEAELDLAEKYFLTFSASSSSMELEWVFFSVMPTSCNASRMALLFTSSSLAKSLIRIFIRYVFPPKFFPLRDHIDLTALVNVLKNLLVLLAGLFFQRRLFYPGACFRCRLRLAMNVHLSLVRLRSSLYAGYRFSLIGLPGLNIFPIF